MTTEQLTEDVASLKQSVAELQRKFAELEPNPVKKWSKREPIAQTPEAQAMFDEMTAYGKYYRITGRDAPPDWSRVILTPSRSTRSELPP